MNAQIEKTLFGGTGLTHKLVALTMLLGLALVSSACASGDRGSESPADESADYAFEGDASGALAETGRGRGELAEPAAEAPSARYAPGRGRDASSSQAAVDASDSDAEESAAEGEAAADSEALAEVGIDPSSGFEVQRAPFSGNLSAPPAAAMAATPDSGGDSLSLYDAADEPADEAADEAADETADETAFESDAAGRRIEQRERPYGERYRRPGRRYNQAPGAMFFQDYGVNPWMDTYDDNRSTFAMDVDTGSYTLARSYINDGNLPPAEAVRVEEFVNYFDQGYRAPRGETFAIHIDGRNDLHPAVTIPEYGHQ